MADDNNAGATEVTPWAATASN